MTGEIRRSDEFASLEAKMKAGTATPEEVEKYERWPVKLRTCGGRVEITMSRPMSVGEWMNPERIARRNQQTREDAEKRKAEDDRAREKTD